MKTLFLLMALFTFSLTSFSQTTTNNLIASCCDGGKCTGSAYCTACKNCSGCKHCAKNGGSCGVCSGGRTKSYTPTTNNSKRTNTYVPINQSKYTIDDIVLVSAASLNLREGPNTNYKIIEKLSKNETLKILEVSGTWLKVKVVKTGTIGYVHNKYLKSK